MDYMESTILTQIYRVFAIIFGILVGVVSFFVYKMTKGGSKGWIYIVLSGGFFCLWSLGTMFFAFDIIKIPYMWHILATISQFGIAFTMPLGFTKFLLDFGVNRPKWLNMSSVFIIVLGSIIALLVGNILTDNFSEPLTAILSISLIVSGIGFIVAIVPAFIMARATKQGHWILATILVILIALGYNLVGYYFNCCSEEGELSEEEVCADYDLKYGKVHGLPCSELVVGVSKYFQVFLFSGIVLVIVALYLLNSRLKFN